MEGVSSVSIPLGADATESRTYTLRLYFVDPDNHEPGERVFDVSLGEKKLLPDFDVVKEAGGRNRMVVKEFKGIAGGDSLQVSFEASKGKPVLSGLEVVAE